MIGYAPECDCGGKVFKRKCGINSKPHNRGKYFLCCGTSSERGHVWAWYNQQVHDGTLENCINQIFFESKNESVDIYSTSENTEEFLEALQRERFQEIDSGVDGIRRFSGSHLSKKSLARIYFAAEDTGNKNVQKYQ